MDAISKKVKEMYEKYPYPSPVPMKKDVSELANLIKLFSSECRYSLENKAVLDAGTGTGHRLCNLASSYTNCNFTGIDFSERSIKIAKELAKKQGINNINFKIENLLHKLTSSEKFDTILCMGVLHHLSDPLVGLKNLCSVLKDYGILFFYVYGKLGSRQRMMRKKIVSLLAGKNKDNYKLAIDLIHELQFDSFEYGWDFGLESGREKNSVIVDAYLHVNEKLFDIDDIDHLVNSAGLYGYAVFGISTKKKGLLFDTAVKTSRMVFTTPKELIKSETLRKVYEALSTKDRCKIIELIYEPNGYTVVCLTKKAYDGLVADNRIKRNFIKCRKDIVSSE